MDQLKELEDTFLEEYASAKLLLNLSKYKSALVLFSKSLFALTDCVIFNKYKKLPKNHSERFRILEEKEYETYKIIDGVWSRYIDSYSKPAVKDSINLLKKAISEVIKK